MKKIFATAAAVISAAVVTISANAADYGSLTVVGDSIASGYGLPGYSAGDNYSASDSFGNMLGADCANYVNLAVDGRTSAELLTASESEDMITALTDADSVVISIGGNDFLQPMLTAIQTAVFSDSELMESITSGEEMPDMEELYLQLSDIIIAAVENVDISATGNNISSFMGKIQEFNPDCDIYILTVYNPFDGFTQTETFFQTAAAKISELNTEITAAASENGAQVVDVYQAFAGHSEEYTNISSMDIHPSKSGHAVIYSLLSSVMEENPSSPAQALPDEKEETPSVSGVSTKPSPDTGAEGLAAVGGTAVAAAAVIFVFRKRH